MRKLLAAVAALLLLTAAAHAQAQKFSPKTGPTDEQKARAAEKAAQERDTEERYRASMKQIPDNKQRVDPWAGVRTPGK
jgi:TRAP-type C4-dicarboxylate transport system substrate-binding protein